MIKIVYACNDGYIDCLYLSILSIIRRTKQTIHFYVLTQDFTNLNPNFKALSKKNINMMLKLVKSYNKNNDFAVIDTSLLYNKFLKGNKNEKTNYSPYAILRLLIDKTQLIGKVIYLDCDVMCCGDIKELSDINIDGVALGANLDYLGKYWHPNHKKYINSGVLYFNLDKTRQTKLLEIARSLLFSRKFKLVDQTALFKAAKKTNSFIIFPNDFKFNTQQTKMQHNTLLKHFCAGWLKGKWQNIKQNNVDAVQNVLKIHNFDEDYQIWKKSKV